MTETNNQRQSQPPVKQIRLGSISMAIWVTYTQSGGRTFAQHQTKITRRYCDGRGVWHNSESFGTDDLLKVSLLAQEAYRFISLGERDEPETPATT